MRFLNQLVKHPVLVRDLVVVTFLSVPTDMATWKRQAKIDYSLEFKGQKISTHFINAVWPRLGGEFLRHWNAAESNVARLIEVWTKCVLLVERYEKRQQQISVDNRKFAEMVTKFEGLDAVVYPVAEGDKGEDVIGATNRDDMGAINDSLGAVQRFFVQSSQALVDESFAINTTVLEKFKNYLDYLYLLQELFERSKKLLTNTIPQLQARIHDNEARYAKLLRDDVEVKGSELARLKQTIVNDKQEIFQQLNRDWLIKECCLHEFAMFQQTQYLLGELWTEWLRGRLQYQDKMAAMHEALSREVLGDMPTGE